MSNHSPRDPNEMSVEDENRRNSETDDMHKILDNFMQAKEETLEELVGGFMYLTMEDVRKASNTTTVGLSSSPTPDVFTVEDAETASTTAGALSRVTAPGDSSVKAEDGGTEGVGRQTEEIEEEVLEDSTNSRHGCEDSLFRHRPASLTKFDNFMLSEDEPGERGGGKKNEDEEEDGEGEEEKEEDWMPMSGYMASFAAGNAASEEAPSQSTGTTSGISEAEITYQKPPEIITTPSPQHGSSQHSAVITPDTTQTLSRDLAHDSDRTEKSATTPTDCDDHSSMCDADVEAPAWALNPGEAEEEVDQAPVKPRVSVIEISTLKGASRAGVADAEGNAVSGDPDDDCDDEVVPFELEEGYDYDSVVYTPKFTQAEMNYLTSFVPQNS